jgi:hypothetical protein
LDLGEKKTINGIKLLPKLVIPGSFVHSEGFPSRFKIEVSGDPEFKVAIMYEDQTRDDFKDPYDTVCTFSGKEVNGRYVRLTATCLRQQRLAMTKIMILSDGKDIAEGCPASDSESGNLGVTILSRPQRPQGEGVITDNPNNIIPADKWNPVVYKAEAPIGGVQLSDGLFKKTMENNISYLMSSFTLDELLRNFYGGLVTSRTAAQVGEGGVILRDCGADHGCCRGRLPPWRARPARRMQSRRTRCGRYNLHSSLSE